MSEETLLVSLLRMRHLTTYEAFKAQFHRAGARLAEIEGDRRLATVTVSRRQWTRWRAGEVQTIPLADTCRVLESMFGHPAEKLLRPADIARPDEPAEPAAGLACGGTERIMTMAARRARQFSATIAGQTNIDQEGIIQLRDEAARLAQAYPSTAVADLLDDIDQLQADTLTLLEGRQPPELQRDLYLIAALASGMMAKASHDLGNPKAAMTHARLAWQSASLAGYLPLASWVRGLESLIAYWARRPREAREYAAAGLDQDGVTGTVRVWLWSLKARAEAALGDDRAALSAIGEAQDARGRVQPDDLDTIGGMCCFDRPRQLYYAADAGTVIPPQLSGTPLGKSSASYAQQAIDGYSASLEPAFGDLAGSHTALAVARIRAGEIDGAAEAMRPVLSLPRSMRIAGVRACAVAVHRELSAAPASVLAAETQQEIEAFAVVQPALSR